MLMNTCRGALCLTLVSVSMSTNCLQAQTQADSAAIRGAALDYIEGWYDRNPARMRRAVHPELVKRIVNTDPRSGRSELDQMGAEKLIDNTTGGDPAEQRRTDVRILDIFRNAAVVRVDALEWVDYLQLAKWNGSWVIVNVLWELR